jgi:hypothetical protein
MRALLVHIPVAPGGGGVRADGRSRARVVVRRWEMCDFGHNKNSFLIKAAAYELGSPHIALRSLTAHVGVRHGVFR